MGEKVNYHSRLRLSISSSNAKGAVRTVSYASLVAMIIPYRGRRKIGLGWQDLGRVEHWYRKVARAYLVPPLSVGGTSLAWACRVISAPSSSRTGSLPTHPAVRAPAPDVSKATSFRCFHSSATLVRSLRSVLFSGRPA